MPPLELLRSGSSDGPNVATVVLYPNESRDRDACRTYVADAVAAGFGQLTASSRLGAYGTYVYEPASYPAFDSTVTPFHELGRAWIEWLVDEAEHYPATHGCHMLVSASYRDSGGPASLDYERDLRIDRLADCAFDTAQAMLLGLRDGGVHRARHENFAIQEPLHTFLPEAYLERETDLLDPNDPEEHQLGVVLDGGRATPMLTGHAGPNDWYHDESDRGNCRTGREWTGGHSTTLSSCTREAMAIVAEAA